MVLELLMTDISLYGTVKNTSAGRVWLQLVGKTKSNIFFMVYLKVQAVNQLVRICRWKFWTISRKGGREEEEDCKGGRRKGMERMNGMKVA